MQKIKREKIVACDCGFQTLSLQFLIKLLVYTFFTITFVLF